MINETISRKFFLENVKDPVSAIMFVQNYVGVDFNGPVLYMFSKSIVTPAPGDTKELGFRDAMCELINDVISDVEEVPDEFFKITFQSGMTLTMPLDQESRVQVEAGTFTSGRGGTDLVW